MRKSVRKETGGYPRFLPRTFLFTTPFPTRSFDSADFVCSAQDDKYASRLLTVWDPSGFALRMTGKRVRECADGQCSSLRATNAASERQCAGDQARPYGQRTRHGCACAVIPRRRHRLRRGIPFPLQPVGKGVGSFGLRPQDDRQTGARVRGRAMPVPTVRASPLPRRFSAAKPDTRVKRRYFRDFCAPRNAVFLYQ